MYGIFIFKGLIMRNALLIIVLIAIICNSCRSAKHVTGKSISTDQTEVKAPSINFSEQSTWLLGYFNQLQLSKPPHSEWFVKGFNEYQANQEVIGKLTVISKNDLSIKIVMGTWCPDSRREVPRFMKILDSWKFPAEKIIFIGVDNAKLSPIGEYDKLDIQRVPTFIIYKNNVEAGRIIENPVTSLEQDMLNILTRNE